MSGAIGVPLIGIASNTQELVRARLTRLLAGAEAAQTRNPRYLGEMASPPTITTSTVASVSTVDASLTRQFLADGSYDDVFGVYGGVLSYPLANNLRVDGSLDAGSPASHLQRVEALVDAQVLGVRMRPVNTTWYYRFIVDGEYVSEAGFTLGSAANHHHALDFGSRAVRHVVLEWENRNYFQGFLVGATGNVMRPPASPRLWWQGDSYSVGVGTDSNFDSLSRVACDWLGVSDLQVAGFGGTGYVNAGASVGAYSARQSLITTANPDFIVYSGGYNDRLSSASDVTAAAIDLLRDARARAPSSPIFVFGSWPGRLGTSAVEATEAAIEAAVTALDDPFTRFIPCTTDPAGPWLFGTGYEGATNGSGNSDLYISTDFVHPNKAGHAYLGRLCADGIRRAAVDMLASI
jgi:lysophospholipase L1-like esterase